MEFKFGTFSIFELGQMISEKLKEDGVTNQSILYVYLNEDEFKRVDEDLFLRNRNSTEDEFIPSEGEIDINVDMVKIIIKKKSGE
jgi:hypothetical protein